MSKPIPDTPIARLRICVDKWGRIPPCKRARPVVADLEDGTTRPAGWIMPQQAVCTRKTREYYTRERAAGRPVPGWFDEAFPQEVTA